MDTKCKTVPIRLRALMGGANFVSHRDMIACGHTPGSLWPFLTPQAPHTVTVKSLAYIDSYVKFMQDF